MEFQLVDLRFQLFPLRQEGLFFRVLCRYLYGPDAQQGEPCGHERTLLIASIERGMFGGQALLRVVELLGFQFGEFKGFQRRDHFVLVEVCGRIAQGLHPIAGEYRCVLFRSGARCGNDGPVRFLESMHSAAAGAGHIDYELPASRNAVEQRAQLGSREVRARKIDFVIGAVE